MVLRFQSARRGNPTGSQPAPVTPPFTGSSVSAGFTAVTPTEGFRAIHVFRPSGVKGNSSCGLPRAGFSWAPSAWTPTCAPAAGIQIPPISRRGAGPGFSPFRSKS